MLSSHITECIYCETACVIVWLVTEPGYEVAVGLCKLYSREAGTGVNWWCCVVRQTCILGAQGRWLCTLDDVRQEGHALILCVRCLSRKGRSFGVRSVIDYTA